MNLNSRKIYRLNIKSLSNRRCHKCCCRCLIKLPFAASAARVCLHFRPSVFLFGCVVFGRLFALHPLVYSFLCRSFSCYCLCSGHLSPILTSIEVSNVSKLSDRQAPVLVIKISKKHPHSFGGFPFL